MKKRYLCPFCRVVLNPNIKIVFSVHKGAHRGLMLFNAKPGDYGFIADPDFPLNEGETVNFHCPVCAKSLTSPTNDHFIEVLLDQGDSTLSKVEFSRVYGEHATFIVDGEDVEAYGEDAQDFDDINFFGH